MQNGAHFRSIDSVDQFHSLGQRVSGLAYNFRNRLSDGAFERRDGGLSSFGVDIVGRMNKVGMAIDASHCSDLATLDAIEASEKPILITHGTCRALVPGP